MTIVYQDERIVVAVKPNGVLSTDEPGGMPSLLRQTLGTDCIRTVHRLDAQTGGLMVFARSRKAAALLSEQVRERQFSKGYLAVVHGVPQPPAGQLRDLLGRDSVRRVTFVADTPSAETREALLDYETLDSSGSLSLVQVQSPHRTHPPDPGAVCLSRHAPVGRPEVRSPGGGCFPAGPVGLSAELHPSPNRQGDGLYLLAAGNRAVDAVRTHKAHMTKRRGVVTPPYALCIELFVGRGQCAPPHNERSGYSKHLQGGGRPSPPPTIKIQFYRADRVVRLYIKGWPPAFADDHPFLT